MDIFYQPGGVATTLARETQVSRHDAEPSRGLQGHVWALSPCTHIHSWSESETLRRESGEDITVEDEVPRMSHGFRAYLDLLWVTTDAGG